MGKPAATVGSYHICPKTNPNGSPHIGGSVPQGSPNVFIGGQPAARVGDKANCMGPPDTIAEGSATVRINGKLAARVGDKTRHGGFVVTGNATVLLGDGTGDSALASSPNLDHIPPFPGSLAEAEQRLDAAGERLNAARATGEPLPASPYSTPDKMRLVQEGLKEKVIVRIIESRHDKDGKGIGPPTGNGYSTYWTTTFTQVEHCDHDAKQICEAVGKPYNPEDDYTLLLIDQEKAAQTGQMESFFPTHEKLAEFARTTGMEGEEMDHVRDKISYAMEPEYSFKYEAVRKAADKKGIELIKPDDVVKQARELGFSDEEQENLMIRFMLDKKLGANEQFLGNGLTNDVNADNVFTPFGPAFNDRNYGVAEVFTYDRNPQTLKELEANGLLKRIPLRMTSHA